MGTWLALGAACTVTTAAASASAVLYRGELFNEDGTSKVISFLLRKKGLDPEALDEAAARRGSAKGGPRPSRYRH